MSRQIGVERTGTTAVITFQRPEAMNSWTRALRADLIAAMAEADADVKVRALVFTGAGARAFGAGQDLKEPAPTLAEADAWIDQWEHLFGTLRALSKPSIAALNGVAAGGSFQFALMTDFRVAHEGVRMGQPEINAGVASAMGPWIIREALGAAMAADLCLSGRIMDGEECRRLGLFHRVVAPQEVLPDALRLADELAKKPERAMRLTKARLASLSESGFRDAFAHWRTMLRETLAGA